MYPQKNSFVDMCIANKICTFVMCGDVDIGIRLASVLSAYTLHT